MVRPQLGLIRLSAVAFVASVLAFSYPIAPGAVSTGIVISQVYGGGGNSGATLRNDFIELFNRGSVPISVDGWSVQYASATGSTWQTTALSGTIPAGGYYLVQEAAGAGGTVTLPAPDATGSIAMSGSNGKVALVSSAAAQSGACPAGAAIVDFVGFGATANCSEGAPTATLSNTTAAIRGAAGCRDTDQNNLDFSTGAPTPRNSASPLGACGGPVLPTLSINSVTLAEGDTGTTSTASFTVSLSAPAPAGGVTFDIATEDATATVANTDYGATSVAAAFIAPGEQTYTFDVPVYGDATTEPDETFIARVTNVTGANAGASQGIGTITNDDNVVVVGHDVVISQVYGGGGNSGATYTNDFIELLNTGSSPVDVTGWSVQYASGNGVSWAATPLTGVIAPGQYFLVQQAAGAGGTTPLPTADRIGGIAMAAGAGKVALVGSTTPLAGTCPAGAQIADLVGYGNTNSVSCFEGPGPAPALSNTTAALRGNFGCFDSDENNNDFTAGAPTPRNSVSPLQSCAGFPALLSIDDVSVDEGDSGTTIATFTVRISPRAAAGGVTFDIATADGTATAAGDYIAKNLTGQVIPAGERLYSFEVIVNGDTIAESRETFFVNVSGVSGAEIRDGQGTGTILSRAGEFPSVAIHSIQGNDLTTPFLGQDVTTTGIVTGVKTNGFFLQTPDTSADADPSTSEGIFVFTAVGPSVLSGSAVVVNGQVTEFFNLTQIESRQPGDVVLVSQGNALPAPVALTAASVTPDGGLTQLERYEAMRVHADTLVSVAPTNDFGETFTVFAGVPRPMREPGIDITFPVPPDPTSGEIDGAIPRWDRNPERLMIVGAVDAPVTSNVTFTNVTGPLDFTFSNYKVLPDAPPVRSADMVASAVPVPAANEFTIAGYNIENFAGNETQRRKAALAIRTVMRSPDVIGTIEIGNLAALEALASQVNEDAVAAGEPNPAYEARLIPAGQGSQHVGFLVKTSRVQIDSVTQELEGETFPAGSATLLHDRPPLVLRARVQGPGLTPEPVIVVVNHLRSFIDIDLLSAEGERVRAKRTAQAESIALLLQELQTSNPRTPVISVGDYNAYEFNDGYTDPMAILRGVPTPDEQIVVDASPDSVDPDFTNLTERLSADQRYSFLFEGTPQALDHVLVNESALALLQRYAIARNNSDFPTFSALRQDVSRPEGNSDHDMPVAYFAFTGTPVVTLNGDATMTVEAFTSFVDPGATARDGQGPLPVTVSGSVDVNVPGEYTITYTASNALYETSVTRTVRVVDSTAPSIDGLTLTPSALGSPNHKMVDVALLYSTTDASGSVSCSVAVSSNEEVNLLGDGNTSADWQVVNDRHVRLRAERSGLGAGRVYTVTLTCQDNAGNVSAATAMVTVR